MVTGSDSFFGSDSKSGGHARLTSRGPPSAILVPTCRLALWNVCAQTPCPPAGTLKGEWMERTALTTDPLFPETKADGSMRGAQRRRKTHAPGRSPGSRPRRAQQWRGTRAHVREGASSPGSPFLISHKSPSTEAIGMDLQVAYSILMTLDLCHPHIWACERDRARGCHARVTVASAVVGKFEVYSRSKHVGHCLQ